MSYNNNVYRVTLKCMAYVFDIQFPTYSLLFPPPYARVAAPFLEGGPSCFASGRRPASVSVWHTINQNGQMFVNIKKNKKGSCKLWQLDIHLYDDNRRYRYSPFFFSTGGAISCSVCFRVVCKQNGPEKLVPKREREREILVDFVRRRIAEWAEWRQTAA